MPTRSNTVTVPGQLAAKPTVRLLTETVIERTKCLLNTTGIEPLGGELAEILSRSFIIRFDMDEQASDCFLEAKILAALREHRDLIVLQDIIRPAYFVPDAIKISQLMRDMQERKIHIAVVIDEFGGTQGIITMEDILEELVGERTTDLKNAYDRLREEDKMRVRCRRNGRS